MSTVISQVRDAVNKLLEICHDGESGFEAAANAVSNASVKAELMQYSGQRAEFAAELEKAVQELGEAPSTGGTIAGALHRGWMKLSKTAGSSDHAILSNCERGEDAAVSAYRAALNTALPNQISTLVASQFQAVKRVHDRIKLLRDMSENK